MTKVNFDDRSQTEISILLGRHRLTPPPPSVDIDQYKLFQWHETQHISRLTTSSDFLVNYGQVCYIESCSLFIAVGTDKGYVIVFNYHQQIQNVLEPYVQAKLQSDREELLQNGYLIDNSISCISISQDLATVAAGYNNGRISIWELPTYETVPEVLAYFIIHPTTLQDRFTHNKEGHLNIPITSIHLENLHQVISSDTSGLVFYHHGVKSLLTKNYISQKVVGKNDSNVVPTNKLKLYKFEVLPSGNQPQITDQLALMAIITGNVLLIISVFSLDNPLNLNIKTHFKAHIPASLEINDATTPCITWFPYMKDKGSTSNAKLAYSWNNVLTILELDNKSLPPNLIKVFDELKDKDKSIPILPIKKTARIRLPKGSNIRALKWISSSSLCCFTDTNEARIYYYHEHKLTLMGDDSIIYSLVPLSFHLNKNFVFKSYDNCIKVVKSRFILLDQSSHHGKLIIGKPTSWNDKLIELLQVRDFQQALKLCYFFFTSLDLGHLVLYSLPESAKDRRRLVYPYLIKVIEQSVPNFDDSQLYLDIISVLIRETHENQVELIDLVYEYALNHDQFFQILEEHLLGNTIAELSPTVLKELVKYYGESGRGDILTEILCSIDISMLDIDLTIQVCQNNGLDDCKIFIYNYLLNDYQTPLLGFLKQMNSRIYTYLSYILTGRQYPIDKFINFDKETNAKSQIMEILFSHSFTEFDDSIFPVLTKCLKYNSFEMLSALNEFFEDSILNESDTITRQYIIDALLDIFALHEDSFQSDDVCNLSIFIGRNYSKYSQFLRLSDSILNEILDNLLNCSTKRNKIDCELAIQSLLSNFQPFDIRELVEKLNFKKFYNVLMNIYKTEGKYYKYLQIWLDHYHELEDSSEDEFISVINYCFHNTKIGIEKVNLITLVKQNFSRIIAIDLSKFVFLVEKFEPELHREILDVDDKLLVFKYLKELFDNFSVNDADLIAKYVTECCIFSPKDVYPVLSKHSLNDANKSYLIDTLSFFNQIEGLSLILSPRDSLELILERFDTKYYDLYVKTLEKEEMSRLDINEEYWLKLIKKLNEIGSREYIYRSFKRITDTKLSPKEKDESSFLKIFNTFLDDEESILINIKQILVEILTSYSYESEIFKLSSKILNQNILDKLMIMSKNNLKGWSIDCKQCTNCSKAMYGNHIDELNFLAWEQQKSQQLNLVWQETDDKSMKPLKLVFFKCGHGYHDMCLKNLHSSICIMCLTHK